MRARVFPPLTSGLLVGVTAILMDLSTAHAGWSPDGVTVRATTASIPLVEACSEGALGTFVAWQEESSPGIGVLRAQRLLASGDLDPTWPTSGAVACDVPASRAELIALPDRMGGVYLGWKESDTLFVTRLDEGGSVADGWPARGRLLGGMGRDNSRPSLIEDGAHGIYAAWASGNNVCFATHLGPDNLGAGGWPNGNLIVSSMSVPYSRSSWPQLAPAPDGGAYFAWASWGMDTDITPGYWRLRRLTGAGGSPTGWSPAGISFGEFHREWLGRSARSALLGLAGDGRGGAFVMIGNPTGPNEYGYADVETRLYRVQSTGQSAPDWPTEGRLVPGPTPYYDGGPDGSYRVFADDRDGALVGSLVYGSMPYSVVDFTQVSASGQSSWEASTYPAAGSEIVPRGDGGFIVAGFVPVGPYQHYDPCAFLRVTQSRHPPEWSDFLEVHCEISTQWYGDIALASSGDGGSVFFWSQEHDRFGLFARHFTSGGEVTAATPQAAPLALHGLRFVAGAGMRASLTLPGGPARLDLFDVAGRRVSAERLEGAGAREVTLPGTAGLRSGLYFVRLAGGKDAYSGKVLVSR